MKKKTIQCSFDSASHVYKIGEKTVPSVTQIIPDLGEFDYVRNEIMEQASIEGQKDHYSAEMFFKYGKIISPYARAISDFLFQNYKTFQIYLFEKPLYHLDLFYAGTPDLVLKKKTQFVILDWKRSFSIYPNKHSLQHAGYDGLLPREAIAWDTCIVRDGKVIRHNSYNPRYRGYFKNLLNSHKIKEIIKNN